jgi:hypothetical protein
VLLRLRDKAFHPFAVILAYIPALRLKDRLRGCRMPANPADRLRSISLNLLSDAFSLRLCITRCI